VAEQPVLISQLVSIGIDSMGAYQLQVLAPGLKIENDAQRQQVRQLIAIMLQRAQERRMARAIKCERALQIDLVQWMTQNSLLLRPMYQRDTVDILKQLEGQVAAATQPSVTALTRAPKPAPAGIGPGYTRIFSGTAYAFDRATLTDFRVRMECTLTAVCLAARLYQKDHGHWPADLQALVPDYLPSVPSDPMAPNGEPLRYTILNQGTRPIVYSVGEDQVDDTVELSLTPPSTPQYGWDQTADQWRDVSRVLGPPPATQPASE
jgi:hypothetical protein